MKSLSGIYKITLVALAILIAGAGYFFYQTGASTFLGITLNTNPDLNRGLVGHWTFDGADMDWSSTTAEVLDTSGQGNTGNLNSMSRSTSPVVGKVGQGLRFNGTSQYINLMADSVDVNTVTMCAWIFSTVMSASQPQDIFGNGYFYFGLYPGSNYLTIDSNAAGGGHLSGSVIPLNTWTHVCATRSSAVNGPATLYVNGTFDTSGNSDTPTGGGGVLGIGARGQGGSEFFEGTIDDVRIYNRALSATEVKRLYQIGATTKVGQTLTNPNIDFGLVGHWTFDGPDMDWSNATAEVRDTSGNNNHGDASSSVTAQSVSDGVVGQALTFLYATKTSFIFITPDTSIDNLTSKTWCAWIKPRSYGLSAYDATIFEKGGYGVQLADDDGGVQALYYQNNFDTTDGHWHTPANSIRLNEWQHVCVSYNDSSTANDPVFYINGATVSSTEFATPVGSRSNDATCNLYISGWGSCSIPSTGSSFDGSIDDVRIYNRILSAAEVKRLYQVGATTKVNETLNTNPDLNRGLVGHWTFDGADMDWSSTTAEVRDTSGNSNNGNASTTPNAQSVREGILGQGLQFAYSASSSNIEVNDSSSIRDIVTLSLCGWIYPRSYGTSANDSTIFRKHNNWYLQLADDDSGVQTLYFNRTRTLVSGWWRAPAGAISLNTWQHVCVTYDASLAANNPTMYVNGNSVTVTGLTTPSGTPETSTYDLVLGNFWDSLVSDFIASSFDGVLDDLRIYNRILSAAEVKRLYDMGR